MTSYARCWCSRILRDPLDMLPLTVSKRNRFRKKYLGISDDISRNSSEVWVKKSYFLKNVKKLHKSCLVHRNSHKTLVTDLLNSLTPKINPFLDIGTFMKIFTTLPSSANLKSAITFFTKFQSLSVSRNFYSQGQSMAACKKWENSMDWLLK